ncbi:MAG: nucleotidyltransferase family protein [Bacteroidota bacterium]
MSSSYQVNHCAIILLAAGASMRMGSPKQLLRYKGKSFLQNMISAAINASLQPVIVVTGANASAITNELKEENVQVVNNSDWKEGIASSIRCGIDHVQKQYPTCDGVIITVCDQPHITPALLKQLIAKQLTSGKPIAASAYENTTGTPAIFHKSFFPELLSLKGDKGAAKIIRQHADAIGTIEFPMGRFDIDTPEDYDNLQKS